jgi:hypothetical protein
VLWREVLTHGQVALTAGAREGAAAASAPGVEAGAAFLPPVAEGSTLLLSLGGAKAFASPSSHRELREEMRGLGLST